MAASLRRGSVSSAMAAHERGLLRRQLGADAVQELAHHRRQARLAGGGEATDRLRGHDGGIVLAGHGAMAPGAVDVDPEDLEALLGDLDRVEPAPAELHGDAAGLVEGAGGAQRVGTVLREPARPLAAPGLLVGGAGVEDVAAQAGDGVAGGVEAGGTRPAREQDDDQRLERHHLLHVHGAPTPDVAVGDVGGERVVRPAVGGVRRDDVEVAQQQQRVPAGAVAAEADGHVAAARGRLDDLRVQALGTQDAGDEVGGVQLRAGRVGRVDRRDADQVPQERDQLEVGGLPGRRIQPGGRQRWSRAGAQVRGVARIAPMNPRTKPVSTMITTIAMRIRT